MSVRAIKVRNSAGLVVLLALLSVLAIALVGGGSVAAAGKSVPDGKSSVPSSAPNNTMPGAAATAGTVIPLAEGFEGGLDAFTSFSIGCSTTHCLWGQTTTDHHTGTSSAYAADVAEVGDDYLPLDSALAIPADATSATLTFWHRYGFESNGSSYYDGGVLEVSTDGGTTWADAGANITTGGYNGSIATGHSNPLAGRTGWVGTTSWQQVQVNLLPYSGPSFLFRLRLGTDDSNDFPVTGWWVDDVQVSYNAPLASCGQAWTTANSYPVAAAGQAVVGLGGRLYSFGGKTTTSVAASYSYDPGTGTWTPVAALPSPRSFASAVTDGTYIYILGGADTNNQPTSTLWRYDPATNSYTTLAPFTTATSAQGAAYLNGTIYRISGETDPTQGTSTNTVEAYTIATNTWAAVANYPAGAFGLAVLGLNGYIYTAGGEQYLGPIAKTYRYDPSSNTWDDGPIADLPGPEGLMASALYNSRWVLAPAGLGPNSNAVAWDPSTNRWSSLDQMPLTVTQAGGGVAGGAYYVVGGTIRGGSGSTRTNMVQKYVEPPCVSPSPTPIGTTCPIQFTDVPAGSPFYDYVRCLACQNILGGYNDGVHCAGVGAPCFLPNASITRGQIAKIVSGAAGYSDNIPAGTQSFNDEPPSDPFWVYVERVHLHGAISGYTCGGAGEPCPGAYYRPGANLTRGQLAKIATTVAGYSETPTGQSFNDVPPSSPFYIYIERAHIHNIISGYTCGGAGEPCPGAYFRPGLNVTRGQAAKIISGTFFPGCSSTLAAKP